MSDPDQLPISREELGPGHTKYRVQVEDDVVNLEYKDDLIISSLDSIPGWECISSETDPKMKCRRTKYRCVNTLGEVECSDNLDGLWYLNCGLALIIYLVVIIFIIYALAKPERSNVAAAFAVLIILILWHREWDNIWQYYIWLLILLVVYVLFMWYLSRTGL